MTLDQAVRLFIFQWFVDHSRPPSVNEAAKSLNLTPEEVRQSCRRLHEGHIIVLESQSDEIRMMMPFSAVPTNYKVIAGSQSWWANCGWDALGISAALHREVEIVSNCADCGEKLRIKTTGSEVLGTQEVLHFALPVKRWWENIIFT